MAIGQKIERMDERMAAVYAALVAALPTRKVSRSWLRDYDAHPEPDLQAGAIALISEGERGYHTGAGMAARAGTHHLLLIGYLKVAETATPLAIEQAELALIEEIKAFVRTGGIAGVGLGLESVAHSRQLEHPYGWVVAYLNAGVPGNNLS